MKKSVKVIALMLVIIMVATMFASCGILNIKREGRLFYHPKILAYAVRLEIQGYEVHLVKGYVYAYKDGEWIEASANRSLFNAIRYKQAIAQDMGERENFYVGRSGKVVYYGSEKGVIASVGVVEAAWVFAMSTIFKLVPNAYDVAPLIS